MENKNVLFKQQCLFWILLFVVIITVILFETGVLYVNGVVGNGQLGYFIDVIGILITIGLIPLALKKFSNSIDQAKKCNNDDFIRIYRRESEIRLALLFVVVMVNVGLYYGAANEGALYCALAGLAAFIYGYPRMQIMQELRKK